jgi:predicted DNA-binding protein
MILPDIDKPIPMKYSIIKCDTGGFDHMPLSLRIPPEKEKVIRRAAAKAGKTKSALILEALDEKLGLVKDREQSIRELAGWLSTEEAKKLRESLRVFNQTHDGDWD